MREGTGRPTDVASRCGAPAPCAALFAPAGMLLVVALGAVPLLLPATSAGSVVSPSPSGAAPVVSLPHAATMLADRVEPADAPGHGLAAPSGATADGILDVGHASTVAVPQPAPAPARSSGAFGRQDAPVSRSAARPVSRRGPSALEVARTRPAVRAAVSAGGGGPVTRRQLAWPIRGPLTSPFGWRIHPIFGTREFHTGIDIAAPSGAPVLSADAGTVRFVGWKNGYGRLVVVYHGSGLETAYSHLSAAEVQPGQHVEQGEEIGRVGSTGWSTGPHLFFEVFQNGVPQNPGGYLP
jgi:hypothetical protein